MADKRISEVLSLPADPIVERNGILGLRYLPRKGAAPYVTWIAEEKCSSQPLERNATESETTWTAARTMFTRAVSEVQEITKGSRSLALVLEAAQRFQDVPLAPPATIWPFITADYEFTGLVPGTSLGEYYTKADLKLLHFGCEGRFKRPRSVQVTFRRRLVPGDETPHIHVTEYCRLRPEARDRQWKQFVSARAARHPEVYFPIGEFARAFCGVLLRREMPRVRRWWWTYHRLLHGKNFNLDPRSFRGMVGRLHFVKHLVHEQELKRFILEDYSKKRIVRRSSQESEQLLLSEALFCVDDALLQPGKRIYPLVRPLHAASFRTWLIGNPRHCSVFSRYGRSDLTGLAPHMLRRFNTTELRLAGVNSLYIARQAGRSIRRVDDYDYIDDETLIGIGRTHLGEEFLSERKYVTDLRARLEGHSLPFHAIEDFVKTQLLGRSSTEFGSCSHQHSISACPSFKACYMGCGEFWIRKGDPVEMERHRADYLSTKRALEAARLQLGDAFYSSHYVIQYGAQLLTLRRILDVHADDMILNGTMFKPTPAKRIPSADSLRALFEDDETLHETLDAVNRLLLRENVDDE